MTGANLEQGAEISPFFHKLLCFQGILSQPRKKQEQRVNMLLPWKPRLDVLLTGCPLRVPWVGCFLCALFSQVERTEYLPITADVCVVWCVLQRWYLCSPFLHKEVGRDELWSPTYSRPACRILFTFDSFGFSAL